MSTNQRRGQIYTIPAFVVQEHNELDYVCVLPIDPTRNVVVVDTNYCTIQKGDRVTIANRLHDYFRSAGVPVVKKG